MGARPGMTGSKPEDPKWTEAHVPESKSDKKKILGKLMELAVIKIFTSNVYTFGGVFRLQSEGSPIGLDLSGEISRLEMGSWDIDFAELRDQNGVKLDLNKRYVDDKNVFLGSIPPGYRWSGNKI